MLTMNSKIYPMNLRRILKKVTLLIILVFALTQIKAQEVEPELWSHWLVAGNKVVFGGSSNWRNSHELQTRLKGKMDTFDSFLYEGIFTYSPNAHWEFVPDYRFTRKVDEVEFRPGLGVIYKQYFGKSEVPKSQLVYQLKWQADIDSEFQQGARFMLNYAHVLNDHWLISGLGGVFYRWSNDFTGVQFIRAGAGVSYIFDEMHSLNFIQAVGVENRGNGTITYANFPMIQLIIRLNKDYKYIPSKYISF